MGQERVGVAKIDLRRRGLRRGQVLQLEIGDIDQPLRRGLQRQALIGRYRERRRRGRHGQWRRRRGFQIVEDRQVERCGRLGVRHDRFLPKARPSWPAGLSGSSSTQRMQHNWAGTPSASGCGRYLHAATSNGRRVVNYACTAVRTRRFFRRGRFRLGNKLAILWCPISQGDVSLTLSKAYHTDPPITLRSIAGSVRETREAGQQGSVQPAPVRQPAGRERLVPCSHRADEEMRAQLRPWQSPRANRANALLTLRRGTLQAPAISLVPEV